MVMNDVWAYPQACFDALDMLVEHDRHPMAAAILRAYHDEGHNLTRREHELYANSIVMHHMDDLMRILEVEDVFDGWRWPESYKERGHQATVEDRTNSNPLLGMF